MRRWRGRHTRKSTGVVNARPDSRSSDMQKIPEERGLQAAFTGNVRISRPALAILVGLAGGPLVYSAGNVLSRFIAGDDVDAYAIAKCHETQEQLARYVVQYQVGWEKIQEVSACQSVAKSISVPAFDNFAYGKVDGGGEK